MGFLLSCNILTHRIFDVNILNSVKSSKFDIFNIIG